MVVCRLTSRVVVPLVFWVAIAVSLASCSLDQAKPSVDSVPAWAQEAVWYQIFVERFNNGDPENDQTLEDIVGSYPHLQPAGFESMRWTQDWYAQEDWAKASGEPFYVTVQSRRLGGDLQGMLDKVDYLADLGVTAIYLNPINDAPSLHKYDARTYRHVDRNFGPDPEGDRLLTASEDPTDPESWRDTAADRQFFELIDAFHERDIKIVLDVSWNHTGVEFWAWKDILEKQSESEYVDWYRIEALDDPETEENEFSYSGWAGVRELPELRKTGVPEGYDGGAVEGNLNEGAKAHIFNVSRRWLDPNGDGDTSDGIDGFRLDVAEKVPLGFWRDFKAFVRGINPDAYFVGEVWWDEWPHRMLEPHSYVPQAFDAVMGYRWYMPTRSLFAGAEPEIEPSDWVAHIDSVQAGIPLNNLKSFMNVAATHDSPRLGTSLQNKTQYKAGASGRDNPAYDLGHLTEQTLRTQRLLLLQQFTWIGSPHIWYGDEMGMWGADDPDNRKPMLWPEMSFDSERTYPNGSARTAQPVSANMELHSFYSDLIAFRKGHINLFSHGETSSVSGDDDLNVLSYYRNFGQESAWVVFNLSDETITMSAPTSMIGFSVGGAAVSQNPEGDSPGQTLSLSERSAVVLMLQ